MVVINDKMGEITLKKVFLDLDFSGNFCAIFFLSSKFIVLLRKYILF